MEPAAQIFAMYPITLLQSRRSKQGLDSGYKCLCIFTHSELTWCDGTRGGKASAIDVLSVTLSSIQDGLPTLQSGLPMYSRRNGGLWITYPARYERTHSYTG